MDPVTTAQLNPPQEHMITIYAPSTIPPNPNPNPRLTATTTTNPNSGTNTGTTTSTYNRNRRSPLNSGLWISIEVIVNVSQIIAAIVVLSLSRKEHPKAPLFSWVIGYTIGCFATLPHLYWRYIHRNVNNNNNNNNNNNQNNNSNNNNNLNNNDVQVNDLETGTNNNESNNSRDLRERQLNAVASNPRINALFDHFKMALDCFFAVWFVVGNIWIFGTHSSIADAPMLYRLCIVFLTFSCVGYAMPFILCGVICCCLPCIISVMGFREDPASARGASSESINALPTYKFKTAKKRNARAANREADHPTQDGGGAGGGGVFAPGTEKEKVLSAEDAVCCICLGKYANNDELRELPCAHFFHKDCVDKWLKINALCPLCKAEVGTNHPSSSSPS
ncbi:hypothetical protein LUZ60_013839 [Juncus effusus]|nr:hypothetical protein LUZ60_013839 [Juncus effusus]